MWGICFFTRLSGRWLNSVSWTFFCCCLQFIVRLQFALVNAIQKPSEKWNNASGAHQGSRLLCVNVTFKSFIFNVFSLAETQIVRLSSCSVFFFFLPGFWIRLWVRNVLGAKFKIKCVRRGHLQNNRHWQPAGTKKRHNLSASLMTFWWIGNLLTVFSTLQRDEGFAVFWPSPCLCPHAFRQPRLMCQEIIVTFSEQNIKRHFATKVVTSPQKTSAGESRNAPGTAFYFSCQDIFMRQLTI